MPLPATIGAGAGLAWSDWKPSTQGPFEVGSNLYVVAFDKTGNSVEVWKSTDSGETWAEQDASNHKAGNGVAGQYSVAACLDGTTLVVVYTESAGSNVTPHLAYFETATDTWQTALPYSLGATSVDSGTGSHAVAVARRAAGSYVVATIINESIMGTAYRRVEVRPFAGTGPVGSPLVVETGTQNHYDLGCLIPGSDGRVHIIYRNRTTGVLRHRALTAAGALTFSTVTIDSTIGSTSYASGLGTSYVDGASTKIVVPYIDANFEVAVARFTSADVPTPTIEAVSTTGTSDSSSVVAADGTTVYAFWPSSDQDLWRDSDGGSGAWGSDIEHRDAVTIFSGVNAVKVNGGIGLLYSDGSAFKYDILSLGGGTTPISASESVTLSESSVVGRIFQLTESFSLADAGTTAVAAAATDIFTFNDQSLLVLTKNVSDAGTVTDSAQTSVTRLVTDSWLLNEAVSLSAALASLDATGVAEAFALTAALARADSTALTDLASVSSGANISVSDALVLSELAAISRALAASDSATQADSSAVQAAYSVLDAFAGTDSAAVSAALVVLDAVAMSELASVTEAALKSVIDSFLWSETGDMASSLIQNDSSSTSETSALQAAFDVSDILSHTEFANMAQGLFLPVSDSGLFTDVAATSNAVAVSDAITLGDQAALSNALSAVDSAVQSELAALATTISGSDALTLTDTAATLQTLFLTALDSTTLQEAAALSNLLSAIDDAAETAVAELASAIAASDLSTLADAYALEVLLETVDSSSLNEAESVSTALEALDALSLDSELAVLAAVEEKPVFDALVLLAEQAVVQAGGAAPDVTLPTRAAIRLWAAAVVLAMMNSTVELDKPLAGVLITGNIKEVSVNSPRYAAIVSLAKTGVDLG